MKIDGKHMDPVDKPRGVEDLTHGIDDGFSQLLHDDAKAPMTGDESFWQHESDLTPLLINFKLKECMRQSKQNSPSLDHEAFNTPSQPHALLPEHLETPFNPINVNLMTADYTPSLIMPAKNGLTPTKTLQAFHPEAATLIRLFQKGLSACYKPQECKTHIVFKQQQLTIDEGRATFSFNGIGLNLDEKKSLINLIEKHLKPYHLVLTRIIINGEDTHGLS